MTPALLIVDVQNDYFPGGRCELHQPTRALTSVKSLLERFRERGLPVCFIQHIAPEGAPFFAPDTDGVRIHREITPLPCEKVIEKHTPNSFHATPLCEFLEEASVNELVICGMMTHMCIDTTVRAAKGLGYQVTLISDACTTKDLMWRNRKIPATTVQDVYMASIHAKFASIITCAEYLK